jgi:cytochrome c oxidase subunit 2
LLQSSTAATISLLFPASCLSKGSRDRFETSQSKTPDKTMAGFAAACARICRLRIQVVGLDVMTPGRIKQWALALALAAPTLAMAQSADPHRWQLNMTPGVTSSSHAAYDAHMITLWACVAIGVVVFGAMAYAIFTFRKSKGAVPATFTHNMTAEIIWTVVPVLILIALSFPATRGLLRMYDTRDAEMTIKVTGYQWMWKYQYMGQNVEFTSRLDRKSDEVRQSGIDPRTIDLPHYLLEVDNQLVLPVNTKVRFVVTADDVIHSWWVPALGWKQDAIPGIVNEAWANIDTPGIYRGQCAELCGKDHGFMPIVVKAVSKSEFKTWLAAEQAKRAPAQGPAAPPAVVAPAASATPAATAAPHTEQAPANAAAAG